jgi:hypothetical protein
VASAADCNLATVPFHRRSRDGRADNEARFSVWSPFASSSHAQPETALTTERLNILIVVADDLGFRPDRYARRSSKRQPPPCQERVRFTQFYWLAGGVRPASLLTGLYAHQTDVGQLLIDTRHRLSGQFEQRVCHYRRTPRVGRISDAHGWQVGLTLMSMRGPPHNLAWQEA